MNSDLRIRIDNGLELVQRQLLQELQPGRGWEGYLSSSALSTAVAVLALAHVDVAAHQRWIAKGLDWLADNANEDGAWGDAPGSPSNMSTTLLCWSAMVWSCDEKHLSAVERAEQWLRLKLGTLDGGHIADAILRFYGNDRTFSAPILTVCALSGRLGKGLEAWRLVPQLPFELAIFPHQLFRWLRLSVVSYAIPALIAIGLVRHHHTGPNFSPRRFLRNRIKDRTLEILASMQPQSGGYLEATPLTGFVALGLANSGYSGHRVTKKCVDFLIASARPDGSWPIDTNLATWVTTQAINQFSSKANPLSSAQCDGLRQWLLDQQHTVEHPFTHAPPGGWAWTDLSGGVPDADDTAGALLALFRLGPVDQRTQKAAKAGLQWLLDLQNGDGGIPTFCRGWGKLPFDRSCPDITAHALRVFWEWRNEVDDTFKHHLETALNKGLCYLKDSQTARGSWLPLWFGNQESREHVNPTYGTSAVVISLCAVAADHHEKVVDALGKGCQWLVSAQNADGGWGGEVGVRSSIEETALAVSALAEAGMDYERSYLAGIEWLLNRTRECTQWRPAPIGLYFASLWYSERLYPQVFTMGALTRAAKRMGEETGRLQKKRTGRFDGVAPVPCNDGPQGNSSGSTDR
jgi:squalene-hopene/tetraprenyl-beta-curcumene cyclase